MLKDFGVVWSLSQAQIYNLETYKWKLQIIHCTEFKRSRKSNPSRVFLPLSLANMSLKIHQEWGGWHHFKSTQLLRQPQWAFVLCSFSSGSVTQDQGGPHYWDPGQTLLGMLHGVRHIPNECLTCVLNRSHIVRQWIKSKKYPREKSFKEGIFS